MKFSKLISLILSAVMVLSILVSCTKKEDDILPIDDSTDFSQAICMQSEHYTVDAGMFSFFFYKDYYDAIDTYFTSYYSGAGLDYKKDLKEQEYSESSSWFDYFVTITTQNVANYLVYAELAYDEGTTLDEDDKQSVENDIAEIKSAAGEQDMTIEQYIKYCFGEKVTEANVRAALELQKLSNKQYALDVATVSVSDDEVNDFYNQNKDSFQFVDFRQVLVRAEFEVDAKTQEQAYAIAKQKAEYIASAKDLGEYCERAIDYLKSVNDPAINSQIEEPMTDEQIRAQMTNVTVRYNYNMNTLFGQWAFDGNRSNGDMTVLDNGAGIYTAYYLDSAPYRAENKTVNIRLASFSDDEETANKVLSAFKETSGTGDDFTTAVKAAGGYVSVQENVDLGILPSYVDFWAFNGREVGDCEVISDNGTYYLCYFDGYGMTSWEYTAYSSIYSQKVNELGKKHYEDYPCSYNMNNINLLSGITPYVTTEETK